MAQSFSNLLQPKPLNVSLFNNPLSTPLFNNPMSLSLSPKTPSSLLNSNPQTNALSNFLNPLAPVKFSPNQTTSATVKSQVKTPLLNSKPNPNSMGTYLNPLTPVQPNFGGTPKSTVNSNPVNTNTNSNFSFNNLITQPNQSTGTTVGGTVTAAPAPTDPNSTFQGIMSQLIKNANKGNFEVANARQNLQALQGQIGQQGANIVGTGADLAFKTGELGALQQLGAVKEQAAQQAVQNALTAQGQQLGALQTAAGLAQPQVAQYGQTAFNPLTGQYSGGSAGVSPNDPFYQTLQQYAQLYASGQQGVIPSSVTSNPVLNAQVLQMAQQINPGVNFNTLQGQASAQQANAATAGTAGVTANQQVFNQAYGNYTTLQNAVQNVDQFGTLLTQNMGSINPTNIKYANMKIADIRNQLSSSQQATFDTTLAALRSRVSGLLSVGGNEIPSDISADARKILDGTLPYGSLTAVLQRIQQEGNILLQNQAKIVNQAYSGIQNPQTTTGGTTGTNQSSGGLYSW